MPNNDLNIVLNFTFKPRPAAAKVTGEGLANYVIQDVGFRAGKKQQRNLGKNLRRDFGPIVDRELQKMARQVSTMAIGISNPNSSPSGSLKIDGPLARAMQGQGGPMRISSVTGQWRQRNKSYLRWKAQTYRTRRWFKNTGQLQGQLKQLGTYREAYGPMAVKFIPAKVPEPSVLNIGRSRGRPANTIITGRLELTVFQRLDVSDLPGIGQQANYSKKRLSGFADDIEQKLTGKDPEKRYRPVLEPFLTYYINRKIPNAVFRKVEQVLA